MNGTTEDDLRIKWARHAVQSLEAHMVATGWTPRSDKKHLNARGLGSTYSFSPCSWSEFVNSKLRCFLYQRRDLRQVAIEAG